MLRRSEDSDSKSIKVTVEFIRDYDVLEGVDLIGGPVPVSCRKKYHKESYEADQLMNADSYKDFMAKMVQEASGRVGEDLSLANAVVSSSVCIESVQDFVRYELAIQFLRKNDNKQVSVKGGQPFIYRGLEGLMLSEGVDGAKGLVEVVIFSQDVDFRNFFQSPHSTKRFSGNYKDDKIAKEMIEEFFRKRVTEEAEKIEDLKKVRVGAVVLGALRLESEILCGSIIGINPKMIIGINPNGRILLGATYLTS